MIYIFVCLIFVSYVNNVKSVELISLGDEKIPTKWETLKVDELSYSKLSKDTSGDVTLTYKLNGVKDVKDEKLKLTINNKSEKVKIISSTETKPKGQKIYIIKETHKNDSVTYYVKFGKVENAVPGKFVLEVTINGNVLNATAHLYSVPIVAKFNKPKLGLEGDPMRITCVFEAYPYPTEIRFERLTNLINSDKPGNLSTVNSSIIIPNNRIYINKSGDHENNTLYITSLHKNDTGIYKCIVVSPHGEDFAVIKVNVKDRWAALYPFIGIVIEVILLVTAILAYEKYQIRSQKKKNYGENIDEDNNKDPGIPLATGGGDDENVATDNEIQPSEIDIDKANNVDNPKARETATTKNV